MNEYDISQAFEEIENELIDSMMRNFSRHRAEELKEGYNWSQWQAEQLKSLEQYRKNNSKKFNKQFSELNGKVEEMLKAARANGNAEQEAKILQAIKDGFKLPNKPSETSTAEFFKVNDRKLNALIKSTTDDLKSAETAVLRMSNDKYRSAIFNAQVYANSGAGTYEKAVDMACRDMLRAGLNCVEYKNGARHTLSDYAEMAIRTANKRAYLRGEGEKRQEFGITTVVVNSRQGGCPDCAPYIGRVFIDDVYSGGSAKDGDYPLLSEAISGGLFHPRCKDSTSTYYEGITTLKPATADEIDDMKRQEALEQQKSYYENQAKKCERISKYSLDSDNKRAYAKRAEEWQEKAEDVSEKSKKKTVEDCKTVTDVENLFREKNWFINNEDFRSDDYLSLKGCDVQSAKLIYSAYDDVFKKFPQLKGKFSAPVASALSENMYAQCNMGFGSGMIQINTRFFKNIERVKEKYEMDLKYGFHPKGTSAKSIIIHEIGHSIDDYLSYSIHYGGVKPKNKKGLLSNKIRLKILKRAECEIDNISHQVSDYATKNANEFFAECFAEYMSSDNPRKVSKAFGEILEEIMENIK